MEMITDLVMQGIQMSIVLFVAPLFMGIIRKIKARLLRHRGASVLQPYYDIFRLLRKDVLMAENASWIYRVAPYIVFAAIWVAAALVPTFATGLMFSWATDFLAIIALLGTARFALALAGMDVGTSFGGIGSSREMMISSLAEPAMLMIIFTVALLAGTTQLSLIAGYVSDNPVGLRASLALAFIALIIVTLAENARIPVDNPTTHLELTMVHEAMILEYSGRHLALIEWAASIKLLLYLSLFGCIFLPFGMASTPASAGQYAIGIILYLAKLLLSGLFLAIGETAVAKMRVFRVAEFLGAALILGLLATILLFVSRGI